MRKGKVTAQTKDHSRVRLLMEEGVITEAQAAVHPERNKIHSCLAATSRRRSNSPARLPEDGDIVMLHRRAVGVVPASRWPLPSRAPTCRRCPCSSPRPKSRAAPRRQPVGGGGALGRELRRAVGQFGVDPDHGPDEVTTKLEEFGRNPAYKSDLSEDEIEKAIEETAPPSTSSTPRK